MLEISLLAHMQQWQVVPVDEGGGTVVLATLGFMAVVLKGDGGVRDHASICRTSEDCA